jgi:hypothetical protein
MSEEISRTEKLATISAAMQLFRDMLEAACPRDEVQKYRENAHRLAGIPAEQPTVEEEAAFEQFLDGVRKKHATRN